MLEASILRARTHTHTHTHTNKITIIIFFWNFRIVPATQTFSLCFRQLTKSIKFRAAVISLPLFVQNVNGLTLALCTVFIAGFFP